MDPRDEYGKAVGQTGTMGSYNATQAAGRPMRAPAAGDAGGGLSGMLHRSGSSSSSSSEDDGQGGRRKKGLKDKIKEKLPGGCGGTKTNDKKGIVDKIKPGTHTHH